METQLRENTSLVCMWRVAQSPDRRHKNILFLPTEQILKNSYNANIMIDSLQWILLRVTMFSELISRDI